MPNSPALNLQRVAQKLSTTGTTHAAQTTMNTFNARTDKIGSRSPALAFPPWGGRGKHGSDPTSPNSQTQPNGKSSLAHGMSITTLSRVEYT